MPERYYRLRELNINEESNDVYVPVDSKKWRGHKSMTIEKLGDMLQVKVNDNLEGMNVTSVLSSDQENNPTVPPNGLPNMQKTYISVDENYLYVWIPSLKKWKRTLLSNWQ